MDSAIPLPSVELHQLSLLSISTSTPSSAPDESPDNRFERCDSTTPAFLGTKMFVAHLEMQGTWSCPCVCWGSCQYNCRRWNGLSVQEWSLEPLLGRWRRHWVEWHCWTGSTPPWRCDSASQCGCGISKLMWTWSWFLTRYWLRKVEPWDFCAHLEQLLAADRVDWGWERVWCGATCRLRDVDLTSLIVLVPWDFFFPGSHFDSRSPLCPLCANTK